MIDALIVDDSRLFRTLLIKALRDIPQINVIAYAENGLAALNKLKLYDPKLMFLDLNMPVMDGIELLSEMKRMRILTRVVIVSSQSEKEADRTIQALSLGAFHYIVKPQADSPEETIDILKSEIRDCLKPLLTETEQAPREEPPAAPVSSLPKTPLPAAPLRPGAYALVAIGVSTGGPEALKAVIPPLSADIPAAVIITIHMPAAFTASLAASLDRMSRLRVKEAKNGDTLERGFCYIAPGDYHLMIDKSSRLICVKSRPVNNCRPSVDVMFRSVAETYGSKAIGVIMTGMGSDGAAGLALMHERGAFTIAQDAASCVVDSMPTRAIAAGGVDRVVELKKIAETIKRLTGSERL